MITVVWLFGAALLEGRLLVFRDLSTQYAPDFAMVAESLRAGVWPLWNPRANAGEPFLLAYPVDLVLLFAGGWRAPLGVGAALHLLLALVGASWLGRRLGMGPWGCWLAGATYGLGGFLLSTVSLLQLFEAAAWTPWVLGAGVAAVEEPTGRRLARLAALVALQLSTLGAEIVLLTALTALVLVGPRALAGRRRLLGLGLAAAVAAVLAAPALLGMRALLEGTARARGFAADEALHFSLAPAVLVEALLPRFLGDPHAFSDAGFWGRAYFPHGYPYLVTLYSGVAVVLLASFARGRTRLVLLALVGIVLSAGRYGPLGLVPEGWALPLRGPQKLFFLTHVALALLAGFGLERARAARGSGARCLLLLVPGLLVLTLAGAARLDPQGAQVAGGSVLPALLDGRGLVAVREVWFASWLPVGALALAAGLALARGGSWAVGAAVLAVGDLLIANGAVNPLAPASFYRLREDVAAVVEPAAAEGRFRWFSYGVALTPGLRFEPLMSRTSDVWLYYLDRQSLVYRTPVLDGLDAAFDVDRTGWAPTGATVAVGEARPDRYGALHRRLRLANVRWVLSFDPLPDDLVARRAIVKLPEVVPPLGLYELRDPLPRAFWVPAAVVEPDPVRSLALLEDPAFDPAAVVLLAERPDLPAGAEAPAPRVRYEPLDAHTVRVWASTPPGLIVVLDGYGPGWTAESRSGPAHLLRANGRYRALPTPGGERVFTLRYRPRWREVALVLQGCGLVGLFLLARR